MGLFLAKYEYFFEGILEKISIFLTEIKMINLGSVKMTLFYSTFDYENSIFTMSRAIRDEFGGFGGFIEKTRKMYVWLKINNDDVNHRKKVL